MDCGVCIVHLYFSGTRRPMDFAHLLPFAHRHCRFKLRNGREVYGVVWEVETFDSANGNAANKRLFFASVRDYERIQKSVAPVQVIPIAPSDIVGVESIAS